MGVVTGGAGKPIEQVNGLVDHRSFRHRKIIPNQVEPPPSFPNTHKHINAHTFTRGLLAPRGTIKERANLMPVLNKVFSSGKCTHMKNIANPTKQGILKKNITKLIFKSIFMIGMSKRLGHQGERSHYVQCRRLQH